MGIYGVKSSTCDCKGSWSTLTNDLRIAMEGPCRQHALVENNVIYYKLQYILQHMLKKNTVVHFDDTFAVRIVKKVVSEYNKRILKVEWKHDGKVTMDMFDQNKQMIFSDMEDEPTLTQVDANTMHIVLLYQPEHHTVEQTWEAWDY